VELRSGPIWYGESDFPYPAWQERITRKVMSERHDDGSGALMVDGWWRRQGAGAAGVVSAWERDPASAGELSA
jgi:hypothetical protein